MMKRILCTLLFAAPIFGQTATGRFAPGESYVAPERNAPPATSRMFVRTSDGQGVDLPATGQGGMIVVIGDRGQSSPRLRTPAGDSSSRSIRRFAVDADGHNALHIDQTIAGRYHVSDVGAGATVIAAEPDSRLTMMTTVGPLSRMPGDRITLQATLRDGDDAMTGAQVFAHLTAPDGTEGKSIALADKGNGVYEAIVDELPSRTSGFWSVRYDADGVNAHGVEFARSGSNQFMNERASAHLGGIQSRIVGDHLHVTASADVVESGRYRFDVIVASSRDANGERRGLAWGEAEQTLGTGASELSIDIPLSGVRAEELFLDVRLLNLDSMGMAGRQTLGDD
jgi:hypothetical protein